MMSPKFDVTTMNLSSSSCLSRTLRNFSMIQVWFHLFGGMSRISPLTTSSIWSVTIGILSHSSYVTVFELGRLAMPIACLYSTLCAAWLFAFIPIQRQLDHAHLNNFPAQRRA